MAAPIANIVQAEFFHVGGMGTKSLVQLFRQVGERVRDGLELTLATGKEARSGIKTGVRFYDNSGVVTKAVQRAEALEEAYTKTLENLGMSVPGSFRCWWLGRRLRQIDTKKESARAHTIEVVAHAFFQALATKQNAAIEKNDHSYRLITPDEQHEVVESIFRSENAYLFIFEPNDLLADKNKMVACLM